MSIDTLWKMSDGTKKVLFLVKLEINQTKEDLLSGGLLSHDTSEKIAREYAYNSGYIDGLQFLINLISEEQQSE